MKKEEYDKFYRDKFSDYAEPQRVIAVSAEGSVTYKALLFIPSQQPFNYYSKDFEAGLQLYSNGVLIMGAYFIWYFHYMPVGNDAVPELLPTPEQRKGTYERIRHFRASKPLFAMDFQNDAEYVGGCIAGGHRYLHINANGDVDPCVFIHYSDSNIREKSLLDALRSPMMMAYHRGQPFNKNMRTARRAAVYFAPRPPCP